MQVVLRVRGAIAIRALLMSLEAHVRALVLGAPRINCESRVSCVGHADCCTHISLVSCIARSDRCACINSSTHFILLMIRLRLQAVHQDLF